MNWVTLAFSRLFGSENIFMQIRHQVLRLPFLGPWARVRLRVFSVFSVVSTMLTDHIKRQLQDKTEMEWMKDGRAFAEKAGLLQELAQDIVDEVEYSRIEDGEWFYGSCINGVSITRAVLLTYVAWGETHCGYCSDVVYKRHGDRYATGPGYACYLVPLYRTQSAEEADLMTAAWAGGRMPSYHAVCGAKGITVKLLGAKVVPHSLSSSDREPVLEPAPDFVAPEDD